MDERRQRVIEVVRDLGADWAVLTSPDGVCYATGHEVPLGVDPSPFAGGPATAFVSRAGDAVLVVANTAEQAAQAGYADEVVAYTGYSDRRAEPVVDNYLDAIGVTARRCGVAGTIAVEWNSLPAAARERLGATARRFVDVRPRLERARATKTSAELEALRRTAELASVAQRAARAALAPGMSELELFGAIRTACESAAGRRIPVMGDLLSGCARTSRALGEPTARLIEAGDPVIVDFVPRAFGYWGDSCNTLVAGEPSRGLRRLHEVVSRALETGVEQLRPGTAAGELDERIRSVVRRHGYAYPHHTGHGIGTSVHEFPRIVPEETARLEPDMVILLEPGAYDPDIGGIRLEWMFLVRAEGPELLSRFEHAFDSE